VNAPQPTPPSQSDPMGLREAVEAMILIAPAAARLRQCQSESSPIRRLRLTLEALASLGPTAPLQFVALAQHCTPQEAASRMSSGADLAAALAAALAHNPLSLLLRSAEVLGLVSPPRR